jgi:hypothetical protein
MEEVSMPREDVFSCLSQGALDPRNVAGDRGCGENDWCSFHRKYSSNEISKIIQLNYLKVTYKARQSKALKSPADCCKKSLDFWTKICYYL